MKLKAMFSLIVEFELFDFPESLTQAKVVDGGGNWGYIDSAAKATENVLIGTPLVRLRHKELWLGVDKTTRFRW